MNSGDIASRKQTAFAAMMCTSGPPCVPGKTTLSIAAAYLSRDKYAAAIDKVVFPGTQGGPLVHIIAAKAVCFLEAMSPEFIVYQRQVVANARTLAEGLK